MAERILETRGQCTTILGCVNMLSGFISGLNYYEDKTSTLNSKYKVNASVSPTCVPQLKYFGCGVKGYKNLDTKQGSRRYDPECTDMDLYQPIPIRCVPLNEEASIMTPEVRKSYRLRVVQSHNGIQYACYFLKVMTCDPATVEIIQKDADGKESVYILDPTNLNPVPRDPQEGGLIDTNSGRTIVRATMKVNLYADEILECINNLYDGDVDTYGRISEYGFYTGCEVDVDSTESIVTTGGVNKESIYVQLAKHVCSRGVDLSESGSYISPAVRFEHADILNLNS